MKKNVKMYIASAMAVVTAVCSAGGFAAFRSFADWETKDGATYYQDENGKNVKGWQTIDGKQYYFCKDGSLAVKSRTIGGIRYKIGSDGVCQGKYTGKTSSANGKKYWKDGKLVKGEWITVKGKKKYYSGKDGYLAVGNVTIDGVEYEFDEKGRLLPDTWGITVWLEDVTPEGAVFHATLDENGIKGETWTGPSFKLERLDDDVWTPVGMLCDPDDIGWDDVLYVFSDSDDAHIVINDCGWKWLYGELPAGRYRLRKGFTSYADDEYTGRAYYAYFDID